jgi:hypothetical protein
MEKRNIVMFLTISIGVIFLSLLCFIYLLHGSLELHLTLDLEGVALTFIVVLILGFVILLPIMSRFSRQRRRKQIRAYKTTPVKKKDAPILIRGHAQVPDLVLPTTGEHVAFYAVFMLSKEISMNVPPERSRRTIRLGPIEKHVEKVTNLEGFGVVEMSGDFSVVSDGVPFVVRISDALAGFSGGVRAVSSLFSSDVRGSGIPDGTYQNWMEFKAAESALFLLLGYRAPMKTRALSAAHDGLVTEVIINSVPSVKSAIDSKVHEYISEDIPPGIQEILAEKGVVTGGRGEIIVVETFIPLGKEVYIFGTYDGDRGIALKDKITGLSVSYEDPESL